MANATVFVDNDTLLKALRSRLAALDEIMNTNNCNNCGKKRTCEHAPSWGSTVRFNCFAWEGEVKHENNEHDGKTESVGRSSENDISGGETAGDL